MSAFDVGAYPIEARRACIASGRAAGDEGPRRMFVLCSDSETPCGVETFARRIVEAAGSRAEGVALGRQVGVPPHGPGTLLINLPMVAWKRSLLAPVAAAALARRRGLSVAVVLHEWDDLHPKRRASYLPLILLADALLFSCRAVERQFSASWPSRLATRRRGTVPVPPNVSPPPGSVAPGVHSARLAAERADGRLILGHFGSIYPRKHPTAVLDVAAELKARGHRPAVVFVGSFVRGADAIERDFAERVVALGLDGDVTVTGYIPTHAELYGIFEEVDVFVYRFAEGLTPRRASVFACLLSGKPVVVNAPSDPGDLARHAGFRSLLRAGQPHLVATGAGVGEIADAILAARARGPVPRPAIDIGETWTDALAAIEEVVRPRSDRTPSRARA